jgi:LPS export ABC transporter protein LptC
MQRRKQYFFCFLAVVLLACCFVSCENDLEKVKLYERGKPGPVETASNIKILYSDSAKIKVEVTALKLDRYEAEEPYTEMPKGIQAIFYDKSMSITSRLKADYGIRYDRAMRMEARHNVVIVNVRGEQLNTEHLVWDERTKKLHSDGFVKITTADEVIFGNGFEANQDFSQYRIFNIKGIISVNAEQHAKDS